MFRLDKKRAVVMKEKLLTILIFILVKRLKTNFGISIKVREDLKTLIKILQKLKTQDKLTSKHAVI
jgi:hypothetical protein